MGDWVQISRLGNPLFNEVIVPMGDKDRWNSLPASDDSQFLDYVRHPELARLLPVLYPGRVPQAPGSDGGAGGPGGDPADRHPVGHRAGVPELHRAGVRRSAATQHGDPAGPASPTRSA